MGRELRTRPGPCQRNRTRENVEGEYCGQYKVDREKGGQGDERISLGGGINQNKMIYENDIRNPVT